MPQVIIYDKNKIIVEAKKGETIAHILHNNDVFVSTSCAGNGFCGKCIVKAFGAISNLTVREKKLLSEKELENNFRLACLTKINGDCTVYTNNSFQSSHKNTFDNITDITDKFKYSNSNIDEFGIALDLGTTTVGIYLYDCSKKLLVDSSSFLNPQIKYGADVISRVSHIINEKSTTNIQNKCIIDSINNDIEILCKKNNIPIDRIKKVSIAANPIMTYIFHNISPINLTTYPFKADNHFGNLINAQELGLITKNATLWTFPLNSSFIGGDIIAGSTLYLQNNCLLLDLGTNGEIALKTGDKYYFASAAAGPAFEGGTFQKGIAPSLSAIDSVYLENDEIKYSTIGNITPLGLCAAGIVSCISLLLTLGICTNDGRLLSREELDKKYQKHIEVYRGQNIFVLDKENDIYITAGDIRAFQTSKAAISAAILTLLNEVNISITEIESLYITGGFGKHITTSDAINCGLIPKEFKDKVKFINNAVAESTILSLISDEYIEKCKNTKMNSHVLSFLSNSFFAQEFINQMSFNNI